MPTCSEKHHPNHTHKHVPTVATRRCAMPATSIICTTGICTTCTRITSTSTRSRSTPPTPCNARHKRVAHTGMVRPAGMKRCPMAITSITWWADACIIRTEIIAMTTGPCS